MGSVRILRVVAELQLIDWHISPSYHPALFEGQMNPVMPYPFHRQRPSRTLYPTPNTRDFIPHGFLITTKKNNSTYILPSSIEAYPWNVLSYPIYALYPHLSYIAIHETCRDKTSYACVVIWGKELRRLYFCFPKEHNLQPFSNSRPAGSSQRIGRTRELQLCTAP